MDFTLYTTLIIQTRIIYNHTNKHTKTLCLLCVLCHFNSRQTFSAWARHFFSPSLINHKVAVLSCDVNSTTTAKCLTVWMYSFLGDSFTDLDPRIKTDMCVLQSAAVFRESLSSVEGQTSQVIQEDNTTIRHTTPSSDYHMVAVAHTSKQHSKPYVIYGRLGRLFLTFILLLNKFSTTIYCTIKFNQFISVTKAGLSNCLNT